MLHYWDNIRKDDEEFNKHVAVITNSDYVMNYMLKYSRLCNISSSHFSKQSNFDGIPLYDDTRKVLFGYIKKCDEAVSRIGEQFLAFVREELKK